MKILIQKQNPHPQFIVDLGNRYSCLCTKIDEKWKITGSHVWQTGRPLGQYGTHLFYNPNTGETNGEWVKVWECFLPMQDMEEATPEWAEALWVGWEKSLECNIAEAVVTADDLAQWEMFPKKGELELKTTGLCRLYDTFKRLKYKGLEYAHSQAQIEVLNQDAKPTCDYD